MFRLTASAFIIIVSNILCTAAYGQINQKIGLDVGFDINVLKVNKTDNFSESGSAGTLATYLVVSGETPFNNPRFLSIKYGIGFSKQHVWLNPAIKVNAIASFRDFPSDSILIDEAGVRDNKILIPIGAKFTLFKPIPVIKPFLAIPGLRIDFGLINKISVHRINADSRMIALIDGDQSSAPEYYDATWNKKISDYYRDYFNRFDLFGFIGFEIFSGIADVFEIAAGLSYNRYIIFPFDRRMNVDNDYGLSGRISIMYKI